MIYEYPKIEPIDVEVLELIRDQRRVLQHQVNTNPLRWRGFLRRNTLARAIRGSNSIEGFNANLAEAIAIVDSERPETLEDETRKALEGYRLAMTHVLGVHSDPYVEINTQFIRSLHFMMISYDMAKMPGQWRTGDVYVVSEPDGERVYEGPPADNVPMLMRELTEQILAEDGIESATVLGAMAHLNLAMIHPFKDGNGRMARALQTLVIARNGILSPEFSSIEEWLGRNTESYYAILKETGEGAWNPQKSALPWVRFCLKAHYQQAATIIRRNEIMGRIWAEIETIRKTCGLHERVETTLMDATFGYKVTSARHKEAAEVSDIVATRELKRLADIGLLKAVGEKRGRFYLASEKLLEIFARCNIRPTKAPDPYTMLSNK